VAETKSNQKIYEVMIAGLPLKLRSSHDEQTVKELVSFADRKISESMPKVKHGSVQTAALLAVLNLAEELLLLKKQASRELDRLEHKAERIISSLEASRIPKAADA
jgi:cell division protein ZapA